MEKKEQKESTRQPSEKKRTTNFKYLDEMLKRIGSKEVEPPKTILVIFPKD